jgi:hypothetical protein
VEFGVSNTHFDKGVDGEDHELWLRFGVVHEVQIDELLLLEVIRLLLQGRMLI